MALSTVVDQGVTVAAISDALEPRIADYVGDGTKESYAGALAKAAAFARVAKHNPTIYGGVNLITRLEERTADVPADPTEEPQAAAFAGRIFDKSEFGNYANVVGQSYAVRALSPPGPPRRAPRVTSCSSSSALRATSGQLREGQRAQPDVHRGRSRAARPTRTPRRWRSSTWSSPGQQPGRQGGARQGRYLARRPSAGEWSHSRAGDGAQDQHQLDRRSVASPSVC